MFHAVVLSSLQKTLIHQDRLQRSNQLEPVTLHLLDNPLVLLNLILAPETALLLQEVKKQRLHGGKHRRV